MKMRDLPAASGARPLSTVLNLGPVAQPAAKDTRNASPNSCSFRMFMVLSLDVQCHGGIRRVRLLDRQIKPHQLIGGDHEVGLVHLRALDGEDAADAPIDRAFGQRAAQLPDGALRQRSAVSCGRSEEHTSELQSHSFISYA